MRFAQAVKRVTIEAAGVARPGTSECADLSAKEEQRPNPFREGPVIFEVFDARGFPLPEAQIRHWVTTAGDVLGLNGGWRTELRLPTPAATVSVTLSTLSSPAELTAFDAAGSKAAYVMGTVTQTTPRTITLISADGAATIGSVVIVADQNELAIHQVCVTRTITGPLVAIARDHGGREIGRYAATAGMIEIPGAGVRDIDIDGGGAGYAISRICWVEGLTTAEAASRQELVNHMATETAHWSEEGMVLEPYTAYRLVVTSTVDVAGFPYDAAFNRPREITQAGYFRTEGPPALTAPSAPTGQPVAGAPADAQDPPPFDSGLDDLTRYVAQTIPPTVAEEGEPPRLPRPVYRAYDVGVQFNEDYVEQLYRAVGRDLGLYLYDANDRPARDRNGRMLTPPNRWDRMPTLTLSATDEHWLVQVDGSACLPQIDRTTIPRAATLARADQLLDPAALYDARLVPLLAHDGFHAYALGATAAGTGAVLAAGPHRWVVRDDGTVPSASRWIVRTSGDGSARAVEQSWNVSSGPAHRDDAYPGGTWLIREPDPRLPADHDDQPAAWTDYRVQAYVRAAGDGIMGVAVRADGDDAYLITLDGELARRRITKRRAGIATVLAETTGGYPAGSDLHLSVEVSGPHILVHLDGEPVLSATDNDLTTGTIALYTATDAGFEFRDLRVDDLRTSAPIAYRFAFATSAFADLTHHLGSFRDRTRLADLDDAATLAAASAVAVDPSAAPAITEQEARAYQAAALAAIGTDARQPASAVDITCLTVGDTAGALLVRTGEPLDWERTEIEVARAAPESYTAAAPGTIRLLAAGFARQGQPNDEYVTLLMLGDVEPRGTHIECRAIASPTAVAPHGTDVLFSADLSSSATESVSAGPDLWVAPGDPGHFQELTGNGASRPQWQSGGGDNITQTAFVGLRRHGSRLPRPAHAWLIGGDPTWADYRCTVTVEAAAVGAVHVIVRFIDADNHDRVTFDVATGEATLHSLRAGLQTTQPVNGGGYQIALGMEIGIDVLGQRVTISRDGAVVFDGSVPPGARRGRVGLGTFGRPQATFSALRVAALDRVLDGWQLVDIGDTRSEWSIADGGLTQSADLAGSAPSGSAALATGVGASDSRVTARLAPGFMGSTGVVTRWSAPSEHYQVVIDTVAETVAVLSLHAGSTAALWSGAYTPSAAGVTLSVEVIGDRIRVQLDGIQLCEIYDSDHSGGLSGVLSVAGAPVTWRHVGVAFAAPEWERWATLPELGTYRGGSRLSLLAGRDTDPVPAQLAGGELEFLDTNPAEFIPVFPARGIDLRVVDAHDTPGHANRFLPSARFTSLPAARIVRAADGTGFVLSVPDGNGDPSLPAGQYRLTVRMRRDNRGADPSSLVLSQSGDTSDEVTALDVPWPLVG